MKGKSNQILFISHKSNRGGATILLLEIIKEFKRQSSLPVKIILLENGPLVKDFSQLAPTYLWFSKLVGKPGLPFRNFISRMISVLNVMWIMFSIRKSTIVFSNTITNGHVHRKLLFLRAKFITYVHELGISIKAMTNERTLKTVLEKTDFFLTGSIAVMENLIQFHAVAPDKAEVIYSSIPELERDRADYRNEISDLKKKFRIPDSAVVFGVAAENEWRKGFDLFSPLVRIYLELYPQANAHFVWMGIRKERVNYFEDMVDFEKYAIKDRVHFLMHGSEYLKNLALFDVHLLLSREDPFPLVVLDAASFATPTICFQDAGGAPEFVESDAGLCIPYGDLIKFAAALNTMEVCRAKRSELGNHARMKLKSGYNQSEATGKIIKLINQYL